MPTVPVQPLVYANTHTILHRITAMPPRRHLLFGHLNNIYVFMQTCLWTHRHADSASSLVYSCSCTLPQRSSAITATLTPSLWPCKQDICIHADMPVDTLTRRQCQSNHRYLLIHVISYKIHCHPATPTPSF